MAEYYMTVAEVAEYLKTSKETILALVARRKIPMTEVNTHYLFPESKIKEWMEKHSPDTAEDILKKHYNDYIHPTPQPVKRKPRRRYRKVT